MKRVTLYYNNKKKPITSYHSKNKNDGDAFKNFDSIFGAFSSKKSIIKEALQNEVKEALLQKNNNVGTYNKKRLQYSKKMLQKYIKDSSNKNNTSKYQTYTYNTHIGNNDDGNNITRKKSLKKKRRKVLYTKSRKNKRMK